MRRTVNYKALLVLVASAAVLGVGVHFLHGYQVKQNARGMYDQALQAEQEGNLDQAANYLEEYLGLAPEDAEAQARFGLLLQREAKTPRQQFRAFLALEQALRRDAGRDDVRRQVALLAVYFGRFGQAKEDLETLLKAAPEDAELMQLLGRCELGADHPDKAREWFERAVTQAPAQIDLWVDYAQVLRGRLKQPEAADAAIETMVGKNDQSIPARVAAAEYYVRRGAWDKAEGHVRFARNDLQGEDAGLLLLAAEVGRGKGQAAQAREALDRGLQLYPQDLRFRQGLARVALGEGRPEQARQYLKPDLDTLPTDPKDLWELGNLLIELGELGRAKGVIERLAQGGATPASSSLQGRLFMQEGAWGQARTKLEEVVSRQQPAPDLAKHVYLLLAGCYEHLGNPDQCLRACRQAREIDPDWVPARRACAAALASLGQLDEAVAEYRLLVKQFPELGPELVRLLLRRNQRLPEGERSWTEVDRLLKDLPEEKQKDPETQLLRAAVLLAQGKPDEARKLVEAERDRDPKQVEPWLFLVGLAETKGPPDAVDSVLEEAERKVGDRPEWHLARIRHWQKSDRPEARESLRKYEETLGRLPDAEKDRVLHGLAEALFAVGDVDAAERLWQQLAQRQPDNLPVCLVLIDLALQAGKEEAARDLLAEVKRLEGDGGPLGAFGEAACKMLPARQGNKQALADARRSLARAAALRPSWGRVALLEGELFDLEQRSDKALEKYQAALARGEDRPAVYRRVLQLLHQQGRDGEAKALLDKMPDKTLATPELLRLAAELTLIGVEGKGPDAEAARKRALGLAHQAVKDDSKDYHDHLWLGQIAALAGKPAEAETAFRQARDLAGDKPETWVALVAFLARTEPKKAEAELAEAQKKLTGAQGELALAACYEALGQVQQAEAHYRAALAAKPEDPAILNAVASYFLRVNQLGKAEPVLRKLKDVNPEGQEATVSRARRSLAVVLAFQGGYARFQEAQKLVEEDGKANGDTPDHLRVKALVLATQPAHRKEAIRLFEGLSSEKGSTPVELRFLLAGLYEADGDWRAAQGHLMAAVNAQGRNPVYLAGYVKALLRHRKGEEALVWVDKLAEVAPGTPETVTLRVLTLKSVGRGDEAGRLVKAYAEGKDAHLDLAGALFEELGQEKDAEAMFRRYADNPKEPARVLLVAHFLSRHGRLPEALDLCEQAWKTCPAEVVAATSVAALRTGAGTEEQQRRVERWLEAALGKNPKSAHLLGLLGELQELRGRFAEAIAFYRRVVAQDPQNVVALNDLAYLLALEDRNTAEALDAIDAALHVAGPDGELLDTRAQVYLQAGQADKAVADLKQAIAQEPVPGRYFHLAQAYSLKRDFPAAREALREANERGLKPEKLHPLQQKALQKLTADLNTDRPGR